VDQPLLSADGLVKHYTVRRQFLGSAPRRLRAVDGVSFTLARREVLGVVGESGCGKSTVGRMVMRLIEPTAGRVVFDGIEVTALERTALRKLRRRIQIVFQDPYSSLNPRMTIGRIVGEPLRIHRLCEEAGIETRTAAMLQKVGLGPDHMARYPHELSGGQRQRVGIARALISNPEMVVADEPVSALDVSIQAQVLNLIADLRGEMQLSMVMISHNIAVIQHACDRIAVMYLGQIVELGAADEIVAAPAHPYTEALVSAVPVPDPAAQRRRIVLRGDVPSPIDPPPGCRFHTRCPHAKPQCAAETPALQEVRPGHFAACHWSRQLYGS
jgi:oligopeptide/dipeptide ABC transporter ATP-binding protein